MRKNNFSKKRKQKILFFVFFFSLLSLSYTIHPYRNYNSSLWHSPDDKYLITTQELGPTFDPSGLKLYQVILTDTKTSKKEHAFYIKCSCLKKALLFSSNSKYLFLQSNIDDHALLNLEKKELVFEGNFKSTCAFSKNNKFFCLEHDGFVKLFDAKTSECLASWPGKNGKFSKYKEIFSFENKKEEIYHNLISYDTAKSFRKKLLSPKNRKFIDLCIICKKK